MEQNKQHFNTWKYLPTLKEAKWWIFMGVLLPILHFLILGGWGWFREWSREASLYYFFEWLSPFTWSFKLLIAESFDSSPYFTFLGFTLGFIFAASLGYVLCLTVKIIRKLMLYGKS